MDYLGFKSTNDPLFKADTTMMRLKDVIPPYNSNREAEYYDAIDSFVQNSEEANSMAFVSSWGEANPGGGKDRVRLFIERSRKNVIASRDGLLTVLDILDLKPWWQQCLRKITNMIQHRYCDRWLEIHAKWCRWQKCIIVNFIKFSSFSSQRKKFHLRTYYTTTFHQYPQRRNTHGK